MKKIAICWIGIGPYNEMFEGFYSSFNKNFCTDSDRTFFIFTDNKDITKGLQNCLTYEISNACRHVGFILFRKFKYLMMAEDKFLDYDYVVFINANMYCNKEIKTEELCTDKDITISWHAFKCMINNDMYNGSACHFKLTEPRKYYVAGFWAAKSRAFLKMANQIESWRMQDKVDGKTNLIPWHDECYFNAYLNIKRSEITVYETPYLSYIVPMDRPGIAKRANDVRIYTRVKSQNMKRSKGGYENFKTDLY